MTPSASTDPYRHSLGVCASLDAVVRCVLVAYVHQDNYRASVLRHLWDACKTCWNRVKNVQEGQVYHKRAASADICPRLDGETRDREQSSQ